MDHDCEMLSKCGFFGKYRGTKDLACRGFISLYCKGPQKETCKRLEYRRSHGTPPTDDMMPNGQMIEAA